MMGSIILGTDDKQTRMPELPDFYLSKRGYGFVKSECPDLVDELRTRLTVKPFVNPNAPNSDLAREFPVFCESSRKFYIPKAYGLRHFGVPAYDQLDDGEDARGLVFEGTMRPEQLPAVEAFMEATRDPLRRGGIISLICAGGKTVISLYISCQLKKKTLVVCHKGFLMDQWRERIKQFIPTARVGIIKQDKVITDNCDIVMASLQSIAMRDYPSSTFDGFHMTIIDEVHHTSAEVFSRALPKITAPVMLGLSATLKRADGLSKVFEWYIGKPVFVSKSRHSATDVMVVPYSNDDQQYSEEVRMWNGKLNVAQMITRVCMFPPRNRFLIDTLERVLQEDPRRKTLVLSDRREHLAILERMICERNLGTVGYYVGGMKEQALKESESRDIILGTFMMACIAEESLIVDPITGREHTMKDFEKIGPVAVNDINDIPPVPSVVSLYESTGSFHVSYPNRFGYSPPKPCVRIVHDLGEITVSEDHKLYTQDGWKSAGELTLSDSLITPSRIDIRGHDIEEIYNHELWVLGCFLGRCCSLVPTDPDVYNLATTIMDKSEMANKLCVIAEGLRKMESNNQYFIGHDVMFLPLEKISSLVGGIYDASGFISGSDVYFSLHSPLLANQLRTLLLRLHIRTRRTSCVKPGFPYEVYIVPEDITRFINIIDIRSKRHQHEFMELRHVVKNFSSLYYDTQSGSRPFMANVKIYSLHSIPAGEVRLCDIEIPIHHSFVASDVVVHNSEGMDIPALNTLVLASPVSSVEQSVGRVQRQKEDERVLTPLVIDMWDQFSLFRSQGIKRQQFYKKNKYNVQIKS